MSIPESALNYGSILTLLGENAEVNGKLNNKSITFTHIAIGDGNDQYVQPSRTQTTLVNEITRIPVTGMEKIEPSEEGGIPQLKVWAKIPDNIVDVAVREFAAIAVYDGNSYLHAVGNSVRIPILSGINNGGEVNDIYIEMTFAITSLDPIVMIDPTVVTATRQYVNERNDEHLNSSNPHPQYAVQKDVDGIKMVLIEGGVNQSVRFEIAESGQLGFSLFYNGADDNATYLQSNIFGSYRNLVKIPREVARWDFLAPAYYSGYQLLDKSFVASPAEVIAGNTTKVATGEGVLAALAKAHSNGMLSPTGSYVFPKDENGLSLIIQWGIDAQITGQGSGDKTVVLPIAFPNGIFLALTTPGMIGGTTGDCVGYVAGSQTNFTYNWNSNNATGFEVSWFALGY